MLSGNKQPSYKHFPVVGAFFFSLLFSSGQTAVKLSGAEAADRGWGIFP